MVIRLLSDNMVYSNKLYIYVLKESKIFVLSTIFLSWIMFVLFYHLLVINYKEKVVAQ